MSRRRLIAALSRSALLAAVGNYPFSADAALSIVGVGVQSFVDRLRGAVFVSPNELESASRSAQGGTKIKRRSSVTWTSTAQPGCSSLEHGPFCGFLGEKEQTETARHALDELLFSNLSETTLLSSFEELTKLLFRGPGGGQVFTSENGMLVCYADCGNAGGFSISLDCVGESVFV